MKQTARLNREVTFEGDFMMAEQFMAFKSGRYKGRGRSILDGKADSFDSLDEAWSQWMDALRRGRSKEYILERKDKIIDIIQKGDNDFLFLIMDYFDKQQTTYCVPNIVAKKECFNLHLHILIIIGKERT